MIHFKLILVKGIRSVSSFVIVVLWGEVCIWMSIVPAPLIENTIFISLFCLCSFVKDHLTIYIYFYLGFLFCFSNLSFLSPVHTVLIIVA